MHYIANLDTKIYIHLIMLCEFYYLLFSVVTEVYIGGNYVRSQIICLTIIM